MRTELLELKNKNLSDHLNVYRLIWENQLVSKQQVKKATGLKLTTLVRIMNYLLERNLIFVKNIGESSGGRKPKLYGINPQAGYIIGIDIARMYSKVALMDLNCNLVSSSTFGMYEDSTWENTLNKICSIIDNFCVKLDKKTILGVGIGTVGPIDKQKGIMLNPANFSSSGWDNIDIVRDIEKRTGLLALLENGVNTAALAEYMNGFFKDYKNMVYISSGTGQRLGLIANGKHVSNELGFHGGFGHLTVEKEGKQCYCGSKGCLEAYVSIPVIMHEFRTRVKYENNSYIAEKYNYDLSAINFEAFCEAAANNDRLAVEIIREASSQFAVALKSIVNILNPGLIVLGGPLVTKCEMFYKLSVEAAYSLIGGNLSSKTVFCIGNLGDNAAVKGAGNLVLSYFLT